MAFHQCSRNCAFASSNVGAWPLVGAPVGFGISAVIDQNHACSGHRRVHLINAADLLAVLEDAIVLEVLESRRRTDAGGAKGKGKHRGILKRDKHPRKIGEASRVFQHSGRSFYVGRGQIRNLTTIRV